MTNSVNAARRLMMNDGSISSLVKEIMAEAAEEALRAGHIIRRLHDFVDRGGTDRRVENLPRLIEDASAFALAGSDASGVEVRFRTDQREVHVVVDRIQIQQVIVNLIRNALEAMRDRKRRELEVRTLLLDPETVEVTVADTGSGLSEHTRDRLFEPFFSTNRNGMGLGLSICQSIIKHHGGNIRGRPNPGGGAIFSFTLTAVAADASPDDV
jgi:C4-dicarboxylate-specific signal transduction histidine kinase